MKLYETWNRIVAIGLLTFLTFVPSLSAGQSTKKPSTKSQSAATRDAAKAPPVAGDEKASTGGPQEGIKIHGHWAIVIKNPDGSVASRHEFENSLAPPDGAGFLTRVMARAATPAYYEINLVHSQAGGSACGSVPCTISEPGIAGAVSTNLTVTATSNPFSAVLQGTVQASTTGDIAEVFTYLTLCQPTVSPTACPSSGAFLFTPVPFTARTLSAPITVQSGQIVQVSVTFTFS